MVAEIKTGDLLYAVAESLAKPSLELNYRRLKGDVLHEL